MFQYKRKHYDATTTPNSTSQKHPKSSSSLPCFGAEGGTLWYISLSESKGCRGECANQVENPIPKHTQISTWALCTCFVQWHNLPSHEKLKEINPVHVYCSEPWVKLRQSGSLPQA